MKMKSSELKRRARQTLLGNYGIAAGAMLMEMVISLIIVLIYIGIVVGEPFIILSSGKSLSYGGIVGVCATMLGSCIAVLFLICLLQCGIRRMLFNMSTNQPFSLGDMLFAYTHKPHRFLGAYLLVFGFQLVMGIPYFVASTVARITGYIPVMVVLEILMYLLMVVGMILFTLSFGLAFYLLVEDPERTVIRCFRESAAIMKGNKGRLIYLCFSFIGMCLLGIGSFGIGFLWIHPYMEATVIQFYLNVSDKTQR